MTDITIAGGAITGPAAALVLASAGHSVTVCEQRPADQLLSAGILGITHGVWDMLRAAGADPDRYELPDSFSDYSSGAHAASPFRLIPWLGLHRSLVDASVSAGAVYRWGTHVVPETLEGMVVDATGIAGAARRHLTHEYSGFTIYRGQSPEYLGESFAVYHDTDQQYITMGDTPSGAVWAYFVRRQEPASLGSSVLAGPPADYRRLPAGMRHVMRATPSVTRSPLSYWITPPRMMASPRYLTVGDVNGAIHPITTAGANLGIIEGLSVPDMLGADARTLSAIEDGMLTRRQYDLELARTLTGPEIGGAAEDTLYDIHHRILFPGTLA